jgi:periplasmic glucans biosynthesis protein
VTIFALLDSVSVTGAYKFVISAGYNTVMNVECTLFPRTVMTYAAEYTYRYRLTWCQEPPLRQNTATVTQTLVGASARQDGARLFFVDFAGREKFNLCDDLDDFCRDKNRNLELSASTGTFVNAALRRNRAAGGHRVSFEFQPSRGATLADIRCWLAAGGKPVSEVWLYRWTA